MNDFLVRVGKLTLKHQPGDQFSYGINCDVLGALIERVSGKSFGAFLEERIFTPLAMKDTAFDVPTEKMNRLAKTYKHRAEGQGFEEANQCWASTLPPSGRLINWPQCL